METEKKTEQKGFPHDTIESRPWPATSATSATWPSIQNVVCGTIPLIVAYVMGSQYIDRLNHHAQKSTETLGEDDL